MKCEPWCTPALVYFYLAVILIALGFLNDVFMGQRRTMEDKVRHALYQSLVAGFWIGVMYWFCGICYPGVSWAIFLVQFLGVLLLIATFVISGFVTLEQRVERVVRKGAGAIASVGEQ